MKISVPSWLAVSCSVLLTSLSLMHAQALPETYDLRQVNTPDGVVAWVPDIQDQGLFGDCWTFASATAMNSNLLKTGILPQASTPPPIQISSWHLSTRNGAPESLIGPNYGGNGNTTWGGFEYQTLGYLTRGQGEWQIPGIPKNNRRIIQTLGGGPVLESQNPLNPFPKVFENSQPRHIGSLLPPADQPQAFKAGRVLILDQGFSNNVPFPPPIHPGGSEYNFDLGVNDPQVQAVKAAILQYGAVTTAMKADYSYFYFLPDHGDLFTVVYFNPGKNPNNTDHEVTIIGWDDTYQMTDPKTNQTSTGAWIVQNSWGKSGWTERETGRNDGTFYASYNDPSIARTGVAAFQMESNGAYASRVMQNELGPMDYVNNYVDGQNPTGVFSAAGLTAASILTSDVDTRLLAIGLLTNVAQTNVTVDFFESWNNGPSNLLSTETFFLGGIGYQMNPLTTPIDLLSGQRIVVQLTYDQPNAIPVVLGGTGLNGSRNVTKNLSFLLNPETSSWEDLANLRFDSFFRPHINGGILFVKGITEAPGLSWAARELTWQAPFVNAVGGNSQVYCIVGSTGGRPFAGWSSDGMQWVDASLPNFPLTSPAVPRAVASNATHWVAVGDNGLAMRSADQAQTWTALSQIGGGLIDLLGLTARDKDFLAVGSKQPTPDASPTGVVLVSSDNGTSWQEREFPFPSVLTCIAASGHTWVVAGNDGALFVSTNNGEDWAQVMTETGTDFLSLATDGAESFAVTGVDGSALISNNSGETWEIIQSGEPASPGSVAFWQDRFVFTGCGPQLAGTATMDGSYLVPPQAGSPAGIAAAGPAGVIAVHSVGAFQTTTSNAPAVLSRGIAGTSVLSTSRNFSARAIADKAGATFVANNLPDGLALDAATGAITGTPEKPGIFQTVIYAVENAQGGEPRSITFEITAPISPPADQIAWQKRAAVVPANLRKIHAVSFAFGRFAAVGQSASEEPMLLTSQDGITWQPAALNGENAPASGFTLHALASTPQTWVAGGSHSRLFVSTDAGSTWARVANPFENPDAEIFSLASDGNHLLAVGKTGGNPSPVGAIFSSTDGGMTWEEVTFEEPLPVLLDAAYDSGSWLVVGENGVILETTNVDGDWHIVDSGTQFPLRAVAISGTNAIAAGDGGVVLKSHDSGRSWSPSNLGQTNIDSDIAAFQGTFVVGGESPFGGASTVTGDNWKLPPAPSASGPITSTTSGFLSFDGTHAWIARGPWRPVIFQTPTSRDWQVGESLQLPISASGEPVRWVARGLPPGTFLSSNGTISGSPLRAGTFSVSILAINTSGRSVPATFTVTVTNSLVSARGSYFATLAPNEILLDGVGGSIRITNTANGTFTARLLLGHEAISLTGRLDQNFASRIAVPTARGMFQLELQLPSDASSPEFSGTLSNSDHSMPFSGERNDWNARTNPAENFAGLYTLLLPSEESAEEQTGTGFATMTISRAGQCRIVGRTADGSLLRGSTTITTQGGIPVFLIQSSRLALYADLEMAPDLSGKPIDGPALWTIRNADNPSENSDFDLFAMGALYSPPSANSTYWGLQPGTQNAIFQSGETDVTVSLGLGGRVRIPAGTQLLQLSFQTGNGTFRGILRGTDGKNQRFFGAILEEPWNFGGGFLGTAAGISHPVSLTPVEQTFGLILDVVGGGTSQPVLRTPNN